MECEAIPPRGSGILEPLCRPRAHEMHVWGKGVGGSDGWMHQVRTLSLLLALKVMEA